MSSTDVSAKSDTNTDKTAEVKEESDNMAPEFKGAMDQTLGALESSVDNEKVKSLLEHFTKEYFAACDAANKAGVKDVTALSAANGMKNALQYGMKFGMGDKYKFGPTHTALRGNPETEDGNDIDFYKFGCDFFRPAMDLENSLVLGEDALKKAYEQIENGENVVFFANHQSEADPQVMSCLLEKAGYGKQAEDLVYVAGHKVTTDALAIPFSMGRNLICIHSKKHIDADPETKPLKSKQNLGAMGGMLKLLKKGGTSIWVAPSGGRDRRDLETGEVPIAPFDQKTIDMFRLMGNKSKVPTHFYPVSMVSYDLCPPPDFVEAGTGEQRNVRFVPVGIAVSDEVENIGGVESRHLFTEKAMEDCQKGYDELLEKMQ
jgi:glycerol-3-phosphate O-acyltransferase